MVGDGHGAHISKLDSVTFDALLAEQDPFGQRGCRFDLRRVRFVSPAGVVLLGVACHALAEVGRQPAIALGDPDVAGYLVRAGLVRTVGKVARFDPPFSNEFLRRIRRMHGGNPYLIEATRIRRGVWLENLLDRVVDVLIEGLRYPLADAYGVAAGVSEVCQNTFDHNGRECGSLAMQVYGVGTARFLEVGVADCGYGLAATQGWHPKNPPFTSGLEAIRRAIEPGVSGCDEPRAHGTRGRVRGQGVQRRRVKSLPESDIGKDLGNLHETPRGLVAPVELCLKPGPEPAMRQDGFDVAQCVANGHDVFRRPPPKRADVVAVRQSGSARDGIEAVVIEGT